MSNRSCAFSVCLALVLAGAIFLPGAGLAQSAAAADAGANQGANRSTSQSADIGPNPDAAPGASATAVLQPALLNVQHTIGSLRTARWKAPNEVKAAADRNVASIQRDLLETLPGLLSQANVDSGSVPQAFAVYRNVDALYDVLLRVEGTARLAAPESEVAAMESALEQLEAARRRLGDAIASEAQNREAQVIQLQEAVKAATAAPPAAVKAAVVEDEPPAPAPKPAAKPAARKRRKVVKPGSKPPAGASPAAAPATTHGAASASSQQ
jgi:hypothetical protein